MKFSGRCTRIPFAKSPISIRSGLSSLRHATLWAFRRPGESVLRRRLTIATKSNWAARKHALSLSKYCLVNSYPAAHIRADDSSKSFRAASDACIMTACSSSDVAGSAPCAKHIRAHDMTAGAIGCAAPAAPFISAWFMHGCTVSSSLMSESSRSCDVNRGNIYCDRCHIYHLFCT